MINTTEYPIIQTNNLPDALEKAANEFYADTKCSVEPEGKIGISKHLVAEAFTTDFIVKEQVDEDLIRNMVACTLVDEKKVAEFRVKILRASKKSDAKTGKNKLLKQACRQLLFRLWAQGDILLPITFTIGQSIPEETLIKLGPPLYKWCKNWRNTDKNLQRRINSVAPRWLLIASWKSHGDITPDDLNTVWTFSRRCKEGAVGFETSKTDFQVNALASVIANEITKGLNFSEEHIDNISLSLKSAHGRFAFDTYAEVEEYISNLDEQRKQLNNERVKKRQKEVKKDINYKNLQRLQSDSDYAIWEHKYPRVDIFADTSDLDFIPDRMTAEDEKLWSDLFNEWFKVRLQRDGSEVIKTPRDAMRVLADYLSICLPISISSLKKNDQEFAVPKNPGEFKRYPFMVTRGGQSNGLITFTDYLMRRYRSDDARGAKVRYAKMFFEWVEATYGDDDEHSKIIAGSNFKCPIVTEDIPRGRGKRKRSTNKKTFSRALFPHLVNWCYAVEAFGMHLQETNATIPHHGIYVDPSDYGYDAGYEHLDVRYKIVKVPIFLIAPWESGRKGHDYPSLTLLRMILLALETGIRMQSSQWLCKKTWDQMNNAGDDHEIYKLYVNTNKSHDPFVKPILARVRDMLKREEKDNKRYVDGGEIPINYENRPSKYEPIYPLFRNPITGQPPTDSTYHLQWKTMMYAFHMFYNENVGTEALVKLKKPNKVVVRNNLFTQAPYCELNIDTYQTPHSCRSTFITRHFQFVELGDISKWVGHNNVGMTSAYLYGEVDEVDQKMKYATDSIMAELPGRATIEPGSQAYLHAASASSSLAKSFSKNREETILTYGVINLEQTLSEQEHGKDNDALSAIDALKASNMSEIIFRETHICPVGENCPEEVIQRTGEARRCGLCQYACKSIDHLPAISSKKNSLLDRVNTTKNKINEAKAKHDPGILDELWEKLTTDMSEYHAWCLTEDILWDIKENSDDEGRKYHVEEPEIIRDHIKRVVKKTGSAEFLLRRIIDTNEYPTMETEAVRLIADRINREIMDGQSSLFDAGDNRKVDAISAVSSYLKTVMEAEGLTLEQVADRMVSGAIEYNPNKTPLLEYDDGER